MYFLKRIVRRWDRVPHLSFFWGGEGQYLLVNRPRRGIYCPVVCLPATSNFVNKKNDALPFACLFQFNLEGKQFARKQCVTLFMKVDQVSTTHVQNSYWTRNNE